MLYKNCKNKKVFRSLDLFSQKSKYMYFLTTGVVSFALSSYLCKDYEYVFFERERVQDKYSYFLVSV